MSRNILNNNGVYINTITGGDAVNISSSNSTSSTCNLKISKQTANTSIADTDLFILEDSSGNIRKITGSNMKSQLEQSTVISPLLLTGNSISIKGLNGFTANKILKVNSAGDAIEYSDDIDTNFWSYSSPSLRPDNITDNLLLGTTTNTNNKKLLVVGDSEIQGDLTLATARSITRGTSATDRITFNADNFTFGNTGIFNNSIQVKSTSTSNSGSVSFFEASVDGTNVNNIDLHCPLTLTHDYNAFLPKITDANITNVYLLSNQNIVPGSNITLTGTETITINATDTNTTYTGGTNITLSGTTFNLDTTLVGCIWNGNVLNKEYVPSDTVYDADIASFITLNSLTTATSFSTSQSSNYVIGSGGTNHNYTNYNSIRGYEIEIGDVPQDISAPYADTTSKGSSRIDIQCRTGSNDNTINLLCSPVWNEGLNSTINLTATGRSGSIASGTSNINITANDTNSAFSNGSKITLSAQTEIIMNTGLKINSSGTITALPGFDTDDYAKFTSTGLVGRSYAEVKSDLSLNNVENTALSTWTGSTNITTLGTIGTGSWNANTIAVNKGGTGITSYTVGDLIYASGTTTLSKLAKGSANTFLMSNGTNPFYSAGYSFQNPISVNSMNVSLEGLSGFGSDNQIICTNGTDSLQYRTLTAGTNITIGATSSTITINSSPNYWERDSNVSSFDLKTSSTVNTIALTVPFTSSSSIKITNGLISGSDDYIKWVNYNTNYRALESYCKVPLAPAAQGTTHFLLKNGEADFPSIAQNTAGSLFIHFEVSGDRFEISKNWEYGNAHGKFKYDSGSNLTHLYDPSGTNGSASFAGSYLTWDNNGSAIYLNTPAGGVSSGDYIGLATGNVPKGRMEMTGNFKITGTLYQGYTFCDERVKENIQDYNTNATALLNKLKIKSFNRKTFDNLKADKNGILLPFAERFSDKTYYDIGLIAQDVLKIPELEFLVDDRDGGDIEPMTIPDWSPLTALCIKSIQEQQVQINELKQTVNELKNLINTLV